MLQLTETYSLDQQFTFGSAMLLAPVMEPGKAAASIVLLPGSERWSDGYNGVKVSKSSGLASTSSKSTSQVRVFCAPSCNCLLVGTFPRTAYRYVVSTALALLTQAALLARNDVLSKQGLSRLQLRKQEPQRLLSKPSGHSSIQSAGCKCTVVMMAVS